MELVATHERIFSGLIIKYQLVFKPFKITCANVHSSAFIGKHFFVQFTFNTTAVTVGRIRIFGDLSSGMGGALLQVMLDQVSRFVRSFILPSLTFLLALPFPLLPPPSPPLSLPLCLTGRP